jgi:hypothetical protein
MRTHPLVRLLASILAAVLLLPITSRAEGVDHDRDGLADALEDAILQRFAPIVLLAEGEEVQPVSAEWLLARSTLETAGGRPRVLEASAVGALAALLVPRAHATGEHLRIPGAARRGSHDPAEWAAYGHAYRGADGGILLQYWFLYPFNDAYWAFDHDGDWEHVTVRLDAAGQPLGAWYARHADAMPGPWFPWSALDREGEHPVVRSARGTHASYSTAEESPRWETLCAERAPALAAAAGCTVWRSARSPRGVVNLGERAVPSVAFLTWPGRWGRTGWFGRESDSPPPGPAFQPGWCSEGATRACS